MRVPQDIHRDDDGEGGSGGGGGGRGGPVLLLAGLADLALSTCGSALKAANGLLGRSDFGALAAQGRQDLQARGRLALDRLGTFGSGTHASGTHASGTHASGTGSEAHMEVLARHARRRGAGGATSGSPGV